MTKTKQALLTTTLLLTSALSFANGNNSTSIYDFYNNTPHGEIENLVKVEGNLNGKEVNNVIYKYESNEKVSFDKNDLKPNFLKKALDKIFSTA